MLRSRDNTKNAQQQNGIDIEDKDQNSSFTKYGIFVCILFTIIVAYFIFIDDHSNTINTITSSTSSSLPSNTNSIINPSKPSSNRGDAPSTRASKLSHNPLFSAKALHPKILGDINPMQSDKLQRLMSRQDEMVKRYKKPNKLNDIFHHKLAPLKALTGPQPAFPGMGGTETKEVEFTLEVTSLPIMKGRKSSIFIRQTYPLHSSFNHDFVLIFLHGAAYTSGTWSELGILSELAKQGYISYAIDIPGYGQSVKTIANNNQWLKEIIVQLIHSGGSKHGKISTFGKKYIIITASMSGKYAMPLLVQDRPKEMIGMITIAPVMTEKYKKEEYQKVSIPICIIYGSEDNKLGEISKQNLIQIPNHKLVVIPNGQHAAYKSDPKRFHQQVVKWLTEFFD